MIAMILWGLLWGAVYGLIAHALTGGRRDFVFESGLVADKYQVLGE
ncbi:hypothetical protein [Nonomuraea sp. NEAU-A123]|nr:hypothetical protein [Nonomuraea sp. NEAU-A123]MBT2234692.1 hypothetical protein [Nonomuraea sp. NEAU-A123]